MDRNQIIGLVMIAAIFIGFQIYMAPDKEEVALRLEQQKQDSIRLAKYQDSINLIKEAEQVATFNADSTVNTPLNDSLLLAEENKKMVKAEIQYGIFAPSAPSFHTEEHIQLENDKLKIQLSSKSGRITQVELKDYKKYTFDNKDKSTWPLVKLFDEDNSSFLLQYKNLSGDTRTTQDLYFKPMSTGFTVTGEDSKSIALRLETSDPNKYLEYIYSLNGNSYDVDFSVNIVGLDNEVQAGSVYLESVINMSSNEKSIKNERNTSSVFYKYSNEDDRDYLSETAKDDEEEFEQNIDWVAYKAHFFSAIIQAKTPFEAKGSKATIKTLESDEYLKTYGSLLNLGVANTRNDVKNFVLFFGPNDYDLLKAKGDDMEYIINLGWGILGYINIYVIKPLFQILDSTGMNIGLSIFLLTLIVKLILFPLYFKNYKSSAKMRVLKPEVEELGKKFPKKEDAMKKQQATMELYRKTGVNPMAGCLPLLIQMPILFAVFRFFPSALELRQKAFLWADDLSGYDAIISWTGDIPFITAFYGNHVSLFTILMAISTIFYTALNSNNMPQQEGMPNMKVMMYIFPIMMIFFFNSYASGLSYYYLIANMMTLLQMYIVKKWVIDEDAIKAKMEENKTKPKKRSKFQERLEQMQKIQQQQQANKKK